MGQWGTGKYQGAILFGSGADTRINNGIIYGMPGDPRLYVVRSETNNVLTVERLFGPRPPGPLRWALWKFRRRISRRFWWVLIDKYGDWRFGR